MTLVKSVLTSQSVYLLTALDAPKEVSEYIDSKRTFSGHWSFFLCFLWNHLLSEIWNDKKWKQRVLSLSFFPVPRVGDCLYIQYNDAGTPSTSTQLRCSCKAVETLPSARLFQDQITVSWSHIISRFFGSQGRGALSLNCQILYDLSAWIAKYIVGDTDGTFVIADTGLEIW